MQKIYQEIYSHFSLNPDMVVKKKYKNLPEYTVQTVLERVMESNGLPLSEVFPEMTRDTAGKLLKKIFPNKQSKQQNWFSYILNSLGYKKCSSCNSIKLFAEFYKNNSTFDGLHAQCCKCSNRISKKYYTENKDTILANKSEYYVNNSDILKEKHKEYSKQHYQQNKAYYKAKTISRVQKIKDATPSWADLSEMNIIYSMCPEGFHVDHLIPLQGEYVCGLHVQHNLQYLSAEENLRKGSKFDIDSYVHTIEYVAPYL